MTITVPLKNCPYCGVAIHAEAAACRHCKHDLPRHGAAIARPSNHLPTHFVVGSLVMVVGLFGALARTQGGVLFSIPVAFIGFAIMGKGQSGVVRWGGAFIAAIMVAGLGASCGGI